MKHLIWFASAIAIVGCDSFRSDSTSEALSSLPRTAPVATVRFPGGNYGHVVLSNGLAVTCSGWSREDTSAVFDVSDPAKPKFLARFPAKGYSCAEPVFFGTRCYVPNGFSATVIDLSDRRAPKLADKVPPRPTGKRKAAAEGEIKAELKDSAIVIGKTELPFAYSISTLAAKDGDGKVWQY